MRSNSKQFERLKGRWVISTISPWDKRRVFFTQRKVPTTSILTATSYKTKDDANRASYFLRKAGKGIMNWRPYKVKETELFLEVLKHG